MRIAEWINTLFFSFLVGLAWLRPQPFSRSRRFRITAIGAGVLILLLAEQFLHLLLPPLWVAVVRDWLPAPVLLMAYWQAGQFFTNANREFQEKLNGLDRRLFPIARWFAGERKIQTWCGVYFELAYLLCYPLVPFGLGLLYLLRMGRYADEFWAAVLLPTYICYVMVPFLPTLPPRMLAGGEAFGKPATSLRSLNLWVLRHASIQANTFPSAHVAATVAVGLELLCRVPLAGVAFLWVAVSIAIGAVMGRYHYAADVLLGAGLAMGGFLLVRILFF